MEEIDNDYNSTFLSKSQSVDQFSLNFDDDSKNLLKIQQIKDPKQADELQYRSASMLSSASVIEDEQQLRIININTINLKKILKYGCKNVEEEAYKSNIVITSKYNIITFLPKNILQQFSKMANFYFLILTILEFVPQMSSTPPSLYYTLIFIISISMIKDIFEDYQRHKQDDEENNRYVQAIQVNKEQKNINKNIQQKHSQFKNNRQDQEFVKMQWRNIKVGQIIKIYENEYFPCDLILFKTSLPKGICYVETKNLDGETNMKHKQASKEALQLMPDQDCEIGECLKDFYIECEKENDQIYSFQGVLKSNEDPEIEISLDIDQLLLRGSSLRNTEWVYGVTIYAGHDSKVMMNSTESKAKLSKIEKSMNVYIIASIFIQVLLCIFSASFSCSWLWFGSINGISNYDAYTYLQLNVDAKSGNYTYSDQNNQTIIETLNSLSQFNIYDQNLTVQIPIVVGQWFLILMNFVSISLVVTLEMVKFFQGTFMQYDSLMYDQTKNMPCKVQSSNLNEELGMVHYIFSDKTGTLTQNIMEFKKMSAGFKCYGSSKNHPVIYQPGVTNVSFYCEQFQKDWNDSINILGYTSNPNLEKLIVILSVCHTIIVEKKNGLIQYNASSPDELALTNAGRHFGYEFNERDSDNFMIIQNKFTGQNLKYELLNIIEFNSTRKRMSVIVRDPQGKIICMTKGADSIIIPRLSPGQEKLIQQTEIYLQEFAQDGLRTLLLAQREIDEQFYEQWNMKFIKAQASMVDRQKKMDEVSEMIEKDFELIGSTAIEDKLQDEVENVISHIREAGIKLWVLTGDKIETAINIGYACQLLDQEMEIFIIDKFNIKDIYDQMRSFNKQSDKIGLQRDKAVIIGAESISKILNASKKNEKVKDQFIQLTDQAKSVLCCRVSPKQKAEIVKLVSSKKNFVTTLAIGDGANDVNMITSANIGIGISGLEGQQAARAADYSIGQFKFLKPLMFIHGREAYRRNSYLIIYFFYKNLIYVLPIWCYGIRSMFSGTPLYNSWLYQCYNIFFTGMPITWFAIYDQEHRKVKFLANPKFYEIGLKNECFNYQVFWKSYIIAITQGVFLLNMTFACLSSETSLNRGSLHLNGVFIFQTIVVLVNVKLFFASTAYNCFESFFIFGSISVFYLILYSFNQYNSKNTEDIYLIFRTLFTTPYQYFVLFFFVSGYLLLEYIARIFDLNLKQFQEKKWNQEAILKEKNLKEIRKQKQKKVTKYNHSGFGFSQEQGNDKIITENLYLKKFSNALLERFQLQLSFSKKKKIIQNPQSIQDQSLQITLKTVDYSMNDQIIDDSNNIFDNNNEISSSYSSANLLTDESNGKGTVKVFSIN